MHVKADYETRTLPVHTLVEASEAYSGYNLKRANGTHGINEAKYPTKEANLRLFIKRLFF